MGQGVWLRLFSLDINRDNLMVFGYKCAGLEGLRRPLLAALEEIVSCRWCLEQKAGRLCSADTINEMPHMAFSGQLDFLHGSSELGQSVPQNIKLIVPKSPVEKLSARLLLESNGQSSPGQFRFKGWRYRHHLSVRKMAQNLWSDLIFTFCVFLLYDDEHANI